MCATVNKYDTKTRQLQDIIYPIISDIIEEIKCYINVCNYEGLEENINLLETEFHSLVSVENKLVFPVILSVFKEDFNFNYFPDIPEVLHLTTAKDAKIKIYLKNIESIVATDNQYPKDEFENDIKKLIHLFNDAYFPSKQRWNSMLQMLSKESVQCENRNKGNCKCDSKKEHHKHEQDTHHHHHH